MLDISINIFNSSNGLIIPTSVSLPNDSNIGSLKEELGYENCEEINIYNQSKLLKDSDIVEDYFDEGDELNAVVTDQEEKAFEANTTNFSSKKVLIVYSVLGKKKFLNLEVRQQKALRVPLHFMRGVFAVLREQDDLQDDQTVFKGFKYNLPEDEGIRKIEITENHVLKYLNSKDTSAVQLIPIGKPIHIKEEEFSKGGKKIIQVENEGPEIYLVTGTKTSFNPYLLAPKSSNSLKILESKRFTVVSGSQFHFGLCRKAVQTERGPEYTCYMFDAMQILNPSKIMIKNSEEEGPNVILLSDDGQENLQTPEDLPQKKFISGDRFRFDDWIKLGTVVASKIVSGVASLAGAGSN